MPSETEQPLTLDEVRAIIRAELKYWEQEHVPPDMSIAATGVCANILAATYGLRAPWHPQKTTTGSPPLTA